MGIRLHVRTENKIKYGCGNFKNCVGIIRTILNTLYFINYHISEDGYNLEIHYHTFKKLLEKLNSITDEEFIKICDEESFTNTYPRKDFIKIMKQFYDEADVRDGYIALDWF